MSATKSGEGFTFATTNSRDHSKLKLSMMNNRSASRWGAPHHQAGPDEDSHRGGRRGYDITDGGQIYTHMQHMPDVMIEISYRNYIDIEMYQTMNICQPPHHIDI